jgi:predicted nucleic acid-binding protein
VSGLSFVDTNIFVYAYDGRDATRSKQAAGLIASLAGDGLFISTQAVAECCNVMLTKNGVTMEPIDLQRVIQDVLQ